MSFNRKIAERMERMHLSKAQLAKAADIPYTTLDSMLKRDSDQKRMLSMFRIAEILGTTVEELLFTDGDERGAHALSKTERALLDQFRALDERGKNTVLALVAHEAQEAGDEPVAYPFDPASLRRIKVYDMPAAAGEPLPLFNEDYRILLAPDAPQDADFGIRISGDSMEPRIADGSIVWVRQQERVEEGEIGIFLLNSEALCKHLRYTENGCELHSINRRYSPIRILEEDDLRVIGKVLN